MANKLKGRKNLLKGFSWKGINLGWRDTNADNLLQKSHLRKRSRRTGRKETQKVSAYFFVNMKLLRFSQKIEREKRKLQYLYDKSPPFTI